MVAAVLATDSGSGDRRRAGWIEYYGTRANGCHPRSAKSARPGHCKPGRALEPGC
jgi:hypothetical protein